MDGAKNISNVGGKYTSPAGVRPGPVGGCTVGEWRQGPQ